MDPYTLPEFIRLVTHSMNVDKYYSPEKILEEYKVLFTLLDNQASVFYFIHDFSKFEYILVSKSLFNIVGVSHEVMVGNNFGEVLKKYIHPTDAGNLRLIHQKMFDFFHECELEDRYNLRFDFNYRIRNSKGRWVQILQQTVFITLTDEGLPLYDFSTCTDISSIKKKDSNDLIIYRGNEMGCYDPVYEYYVPHGSSYGISPREVEIMDYVVKGLSSKQIADTCRLSINTVKNHRKNILKKTNSTTFSEAGAKIKIY